MDLRYQLPRPSSLGFGLAIALTAALIVSMAAFAAAGSAKTPKCFGKRATIVGHGNGDHLKGGRGRDVIVGTRGDDKINGKQGHDLICSRGGDDVIHAAEGTNKMNGGSGDDWLDSRRGRGAIALGGSGKDFIETEGTIAGGKGADRIESFGYLSADKSPYEDRTSGGSGRDKIRGLNYWYDETTQPTQELSGGPDDDKITGGRSDDTLNGNGGDDALNGLGGEDRCDQGSGSGPLVNCENIEKRMFGARVGGFGRRPQPASIAYRRALRVDSTIGSGPAPPRWRGGTPPSAKR